MNNLSGNQTNALGMALLFVLMVAVLRINDCNASDNVTALASTPLDLTYDRKLISGRIQNVALGVVLDTLVRNVGLRVSFHRSGYRAAAGFGPIAQEPLGTRSHGDLVRLFLCPILGRSWNGRGRTLNAS